MRRPIIAMNLKNYINKEEESRILFKELLEELTVLDNLDKIDVYLIPSMGNIHVARDVFKNSLIKFGAQNIAPSLNGPFTGEYSIESLIDIGGSIVEIGHYERITLFSETPTMINQKIKITLEEKLTPLICVGSEEEILEHDRFKDYITNQLTSYFNEITLDRSQNLILAYEPGWAIGKPEAAPVDLVHSNHQIIRDVLTELFSEDIANHIQLIYGGSVSKENAEILTSDNNVDGLFIGRFGHKPSNFKDILESILTIKMR